MTFLAGIEFTQAQNVSIPDATFKAALVGNSLINTNSDTEIQVSEASVFSGSINVNTMSITSLTGIEAFVSLTLLDCSQNQLTSLNVSTNTALGTLRCSNNLITSLNVSTNTALTVLDCGSNQLTSLDLSNNILLGYLSITSNSITSLDISGNPSVYVAYCGYNQLTSLNVKNGNNTNFWSLTALSNPNLICIEVDDSTYSATNWLTIDATAHFSEDCSAELSLNEFSEIETMKIYPNPANEILNIESEISTTISIINMIGEEVYQGNVYSNSTIDVSGFSSGIYFIKDLNKNQVIKFIKK